MDPSSMCTDVQVYRACEIPSPIRQGQNKVEGHKFKRHEIPVSPEHEQAVPVAIIIDNLNDRFYKFRDLVPELRIEIWKMAITAAMGTVVHFAFDSHKKIPNVANSCFEARSEFHRAKGYFPFYMQLKHRKFTWSWVNFHLDTFVLNLKWSNGPDVDSILMPYPPQFRFAMQYLRIQILLREPSWPYNVERRSGIFQHLPFLTGLRTITFEMIWNFEEVAQFITSNATTNIPIDRFQANSRVIGEHSDVVHAFYEKCDYIRDELRRARKACPWWRSENVEFKFVLQPGTHTFSFRVYA